MADLRIVGVSNNQLELQGPDGSRHYLPINEDLVKAIRSRQVSLPQSISPRDIQQMIRVGASIDDVVAKTGADIELVSRFAKPIIAERNHIVTLARNIRLAMALDRFSEQSPVEFGNVIDERLGTNGASSISWSASKTLDGEWLVSIDFEIDGKQQNATWSFDPKKLFLSPENETALQLSNNIPLKVSAPSTPIVESAKVVDNSEVPNLRVVPEVVETNDEVIEETSNISLLEELFVEEDTATITAIHPIVDEHPSSTSQDQLDESDSDFDSTDPFPSEEPAKPQSNSRWAEVLFGNPDEETDSETDSN